MSRNIPVLIATLLLISSSAHAQYTVSSLADLPDSDLTDELYSPTTLRSAIENINKRGVAATILIAPTLEYKTITLASTLPAATPKITFDGKGIHLDGANNSAITSGLFVRGNGSSVRNIMIENINGSGLVWQASDGVIEMMIVRNCNGPGMNFNGAKNNVIGGSLLGYFSNYIYGCSGTGGNGLSFILGSSDNEIQFTAIGVNELYRKAPNSRHGIFSEDERLHIHHNLISGNEYGGITIDGRGKAMFTRIYENRIGTDDQVTDTIPNLQHGISISRSSDDTIRNNIISGNIGNGIYVADATARRITIINNIVGVNRKTTKPLPNQNGIRLNGADHVVTGNVVSGNTFSGISTSANTTIIEGNIIGLDSTARIAMGNGSHGIHCSFLTDAVIGPVSGDGAWNVIGSNGGSGIVLASAGMENVRVTHNLIGSTFQMDSARANGMNGIHILYDARNIDIEDNYLPSNWGDGIRIERNVVIFLDPNRPPIYQRPSNIRITANMIGWAGNTDSVLFHGRNGVSILNADSIFIERNVIAGCTYNGIEIANDSTRYVVVRNNQIGALETDPITWNNGRSGVYVDGAKEVIIGDEIDGKKGNNIERNQWWGVQVAYGAQNVKILGNRICANGNGGIALDTFETYYYQHAYDAFDADSGSNMLQNTPWMWIGAKKDGKLRVAGFLDGKPNTAYRIDVGLDEVIPDSIWYTITGCDYVGWFSVRTDSIGYAVFDTLLAVTDLDARLAKHSVVTTTATGTDGTSQFSLKPLAPPDELAIDIAITIDTARTKVYDDGRAELTAIITNRGFDRATLVTVHDSIGVWFSADSMGISKGVVDVYDTVVTATIPTIDPGEQIVLRVVGRSLVTGTHVRHVRAWPSQRDLVVSNNRDSIVLDVEVVNSIDEKGADQSTITYGTDGTVRVHGFPAGSYTVQYSDLGGRSFGSATRIELTEGEPLSVVPPRGARLLLLDHDGRRVGQWVVW
ncbi:MAG TPA: right-handed parallel beta-helix repeat-containing protein [Candidatus Didemnitutus sp.]|nr:right-handed parallel beta-helix repeat-containing protein [Candidatus Didemnitutus sp.]